MIRPAISADAPRIAEIYNEGIEDRSATFETQLRGAGDVRNWLADNWDKHGEPPALPAEIVERTRERYATLLRLLTAS